MQATEEAIPKKRGRPRGIRGSNVRDLTGQKFNQWTVLEDIGLSRHNKMRWRCRCACGFIGDLDASSLTGGKSKSCGCLRIGKPRSLRPAKVFHGMSGTPECSAWHDAKRRCYNPRNTAFIHYGGRGVKMCADLMQSPAALLDSIGARPPASRARELSLDRIDVNGHYSCGKCAECVTNKWPMNLRWSTQKIQTRNTRHNRMITHQGMTLCVAEWAEKLGINKNVIYHRVHRGVTDAATLLK